MNLVTAPALYALAAICLLLGIATGVQWSAKQRALVRAADAEKALATYTADNAKALAQFQVEARQQEQRHSADMARIQREAADKAKEVGDAAYNRAVADVRAGRLRNVWTCPATTAVPATGGATAGSDGTADDREAAVGRILRIGAEADQRIRDCQAVIKADRYHAQTNL